MRKEFDVPKFRKLVALFDSDKEGEANAAFRTATKMCEAHGLRFPEVLAETFSETRIVYEAPPRRTWRERFAQYRLRKVLHEVAVFALICGLAILCGDAVLSALRLLVGRVKGWVDIVALLVLLAGGMPGDWVCNLCETIVDRLEAVLWK
jgi:hypothetical protein